MKRENDGTVQSQLRALNLLELLAEDDEGYRLIDLAERSGLSTSTTHRLLSTLEQKRFVQLDRDENLWHVGVQCFSIGAAFARRRSLTRIALPIMRRLRDATGETVNLGLLDQGDVVFLTQVESREVEGQVAVMETRARIRRVELMPLEQDRALAVLMTDSGWITVRAITLDRAMPADEVRKLGRELTRRFADRTVQEIVDMETTPADPLDALHTRARGLTEQVLAILRGRTLYISGATNILDHPEFWDIEMTRELLRTFERKERLADLMASLAEAEGVRVTIGEENPVSEMRECTLITSTYTYRSQVVGILGVVGPRRLPYPEIISVVDDTARHVSEALSRVRHELYLPS